MDSKELRIKIYERLGLEFGSLSSEGGNDWVRAEKEVLEEYRQQEFEKLKDMKSVDYLTVDKNSDEFISAINTTALIAQNYKIIIAQRNDLSMEDIDKLIEDGNKDILINLSRYQKLNNSQIERILLKATYLCKKYLLEKQDLSKNIKEKISI
ncbi:hypothetical protein [Arcobacter aquimarinus]|uniref:Uncharacterized protein n=1 Tax=Arcobacter aquimarinus TaxID=1315211 RepID=A0AAE7E1Y2_9BACT|nr:hypothetical protein [Arcobacter aquimarinus]QKE27130.1 hypothetical protein AAQM_2433 [Arcobacter aquimarinus]RXI35494.1 hypothetical protein CP986_06490 [Arcobacter aquimarinus]